MDSMPLVIRPLLHPYEKSRLPLAWVAIVLAVILSPLIFFFIYVVLLVWFLVQVSHARLLGGGVRVSEDTLPELQRALTEVRQQLGYHRPVDIYVVEKADPPAFVVSYLGTRIIVFEGGLVADLQSQENRPQLVFLIAQLLAALKARHLRFGPVSVVFNSLQSLKFLNLLLNPYVRASTYSGDQIGMACCGDIRAAFAAMQRLLVGKDLAPSLVTLGLLEQVAEARRRWMLRLAQLFQRYPHLTNRYLNLLRFAAESQPAAFLAYRATLDQETNNRLTTALAAAPGFRSRPVAEAIPVAGVEAAEGVPHGEPSDRNQRVTPGGSGVAEDFTVAHGTAVPLDAGTPQGRTDNPPD